MKTDRELLEQALKLIYKYHARETVLVDWEKSVIEDIKARLAEDDEEPVGYLWESHFIDTGKPIKLWLDTPEFPPGVVSDLPIVPVYRRPQHKARLTDEEIVEIVRESSRGSAINRDGSTSFRIARAIEQKIWEKNREF